MNKSTARARLADQERDFELEFPSVTPGTLDQHEEWCRVRYQGEEQKIRFHDYGRIYEIPGLYEELFYNRLHCTSPKTVVGLLREVLALSAIKPATLRGLDVGAGNGMVGEALRAAGVASVTGVDLLPEAAMAASRDRPGTYRDYVVADLTRLPAKDRRRLAAARPNLITTVAALGFGDIPHAAFVTAWNLIEKTSWVAFNIKEAFLSERYQFGFSLLVRRLVDRGRLVIRAQKRYVHRLSLAGDPLHYVAIVGTKTGNIPKTWLADLKE